MSDYQFLLISDDDTSSIDIYGAACDVSAVIEAIAQFREKLADNIGYEDFKAAEEGEYSTCVHLGYVDHIAAMCRDDPKPHIFTMSRFSGPVEIWVRPSDYRNP